MCEECSKALKVISLGNGHFKCYVWTSLQYADTSDCIVSFLTPHIEAHVRYNLLSLSCTIQSFGSSLYDINLGATATTILRIRGVQIPIDLVSSATDSLGEV